MSKKKTQAFNVFSQIGICNCSNTIKSSKQSKEGGKRDAKKNSVGATLGAIIIAKFWPW